MTTDPPYLPFSLTDLWKNAAPEMLLVKQAAQARFDAAALFPMVPRVMVGYDPAGKAGDKTSVTMVTQTKFGDIKFIEDALLPDNSMMVFDDTYKRAGAMLDDKIRDALLGPAIAPRTAMLTATQVAQQDAANGLDIQRMMLDLDKWLMPARVKGDFADYYLQQ